MRVEQTELYQAMLASGRYEDEDYVIATIDEMRERVATGEDPEEVLYEEGFEPDYIFDLI
jgi:hypothetical protein